MRQLLEHTSQWGPIVGLVICFTIFTLVLLHQLSDRRPKHAKKMSALPLNDGEGVHHD